MKVPPPPAHFFLLEEWLALALSNDIFLAEPHQVNKPNPVLGTERLPAQISYNKIEFFSGSCNFQRATE